MSRKELDWNYLFIPVTSDLKHVRDAIKDEFPSADGIFFRIYADGSFRVSFSHEIDVTDKGFVAKETQLEVNRKLKSLERKLTDNA